MGQAPTVISVAGKAAQRDVISEHRAGRSNAGNWPMESEALAVNADQVRDAIGDAGKMGVPTDFNLKTGAPIFTSRGHRRRYCEVYGFYDRNGGYSDPQRA